MTAPTQARSYNYQAIEDAWTKGTIAVLDSMPGSGKTTAITDYLRDEKLNHVIFVSPFKSEVEQELPKRKLKGLHYAHPHSGKGGKVTQLKELITKGDNSSGNKLHRITCTHSAFTRLPCNIKARNDFGHITNCLYAFSLNPPPSLVILLSARSGIELEKIKATFKLNNLLQFIYRGTSVENLTERFNIGFGAKTTTNNRCALWAV